MTSYGRAEHPSVRHVLGNRQSVCVARVTPIVARLGSDVDKVNVDRLLQTYVGLMRGARNEREVEEALERAVRAALPARDELTAVEGIMDRREAGQASINANTEASLVADGFDPAIAKLATEKAADFDTKPIEVAPKDELGHIEQIMAARQADAE
jgi:hypothetical protein